MSRLDTPSGCSRAIASVTSLRRTSSGRPSQLVSPSVEELTLGYGIQFRQNAFARVDLVKRDWKDFYAAKLMLSNPTVIDPFGQKSDVRFLVNDDQTKRSYRAIQSSASWRPTSPARANRSPGSSARAHTTSSAPVAR